MPRLLAPDWSVHDVPTSAALQELVGARGINGDLAANLRQLCGFDKASGTRQLSGIACPTADPVVAGALTHPSSMCLITFIAAAGAAPAERLGFSHAAGRHQLCTG